jgi:hypothetical protein
MNNTVISAPFPVNLNNVPIGSGVQVEGKTYVEIGAVERLMHDLLKQQREICSKTGTHHKFGYYRYKPDDMVNAKSPLETKVEPEIPAKLRLVKVSGELNGSVFTEQVRGMNGYESMFRVFKRFDGKTFKKITVQIDCDLVSASEFQELINGLTIAGRCLRS